MKHIRQKSQNDNILPVAYTVVNTDGWDGPLEDYPCMIEHPDLFEISYDEIPEYAQYLNYISV